jgi:hypothetical protein
METIRITWKVTLQILRAEATRDALVYVGRKAYNKIDYKIYRMIV